MSGISFLYNEYKKNPTKIEELLSSTIEISEQLAGSRFSVQRNNDGTFKFFKRNDVPISNIDRTLSKYFEKAIYHFENLPKDATINMQDNWRFGMEYFPNLQPVTIAYDRLPLNHLVLTSIHVKDLRGKTIEVISDRETLAEWAEQLQVEQPPIYFEGKLTDEQKAKLIDFLNTPYDSLLKRFKTENFTSFILKLLNSKLTGSFLNDSLDKDIDGLIFRFDGKEVYKVADPDYVHKKIKKVPEKPSDIYNLTVVMLQEYVMSLDFDKIKLTEKSFSERYIEFICKVFNMFVKTPMYKEGFDGIDFELPEFLTRKDAELNFEFVKNAKTKEILRESNTNRELFKILLASMRSHKKRASGFFSQELISHHNALVDKIKDYINGNIKESFFSFEEFKNTFLNETTDWDEYGNNAINEDEIEEDAISLNEIDGRIVEEDAIKGGKGDKTKIADVDQNELKIGIAVEEHTNDVDRATEIALDHLTEDPKYYSKLILSGIVDEPEALRLAKELLNIVPAEKKEVKEEPVIMSDGLYVDALTKIFKKLATNPTTKKKTKGHCIMKGKFFPYHNGHDTAINDAAEETGAKVFIILNDTMDKLKTSIMDEVMQNNKNIAGYVFGNVNSLKEIKDVIKGKSDIMFFSGDKDECEDIYTQDSSIVTVPATRHIKVDSVLQKIQSDDIDGYKKLVPTYLHNFFYKIKTELDEHTNV